MKCSLFIIFFVIINIISASNNYVEATQLAYKPIKHSSLINFHISLYKTNPAFGAQWWASNNLLISGMISPMTNNNFNLYNNFSLGYNTNIDWFYSSSNFIEISIHKKKYDNYNTRWINCAYKSRYDLKNIILGYDINHFFWKENIKNNFLSLIIGYNINKKMILEFKSDINKNNIFNSLNLSIPL